jgi:TolA-binding protein
MHRVLSLMAVLVAMTAAHVAFADSGQNGSSSSSSSSSASSGGGSSCISDTAKQALSACPNSGPQSFTAHGKTPTVSFHSQLDTSKPLKDNKPVNPSEQMAAAQRDPRKVNLQQRALALLVKEIQGLESLYRDTELRSKDRPNLLRRLAEDYVELENAAFREKTEAEIQRDNCKKNNNAQCAGRQQAIANARTTTLNGARGAAIKYYNTLVSDYSGTPSQNFANNPPPAYTQLDEVYYYLAYEYEQAQDYANARRVYLDLITKTPNSKYIPNAYLAFGELFFQDAQGDPTKWKPAKEAYEKVIEKPPPDNKVFGYAHYKLAYVFWNTGDYQHALGEFKKTIDYGVQYSQLPNAAKLADSARRDVIPVYALTGDPTAAYNFFKNLSGDTGGSNDKTFKMMDDLGNNYLDTGHYPEAIQLYKDLLVRDGSGEKVCIYQSHITEATMAMKSGNKDVIVRELQNQLKRYNTYKNENHSADAKQECANKTAAMLTETAMAWHLEAVGSSGQRGTGDPNTMAAAAALYGAVAKTWNADDFSKFTFPKLVKEDWPSIYKIKYNMADLLYFREDWAGCGPAFDAVVAENPNAPEAAEAAYAAVLCYQNIYLAQHQKGSDKKGSGNLPGVGKDIKAESDDKYKPKDLTDGQKGMVAAFNRYICYIHPDKNDSDGQKQLVEVKYARGRTYFEAQHWEEAAGAFRDIAFNNQDSDLAPYAANLYLESINVLTWHGNPPRGQCIDDMVADVPKFIDMECGGDKLAKNQDTCTTLAKVQCDIQRLRAQRMVEEADKGGQNAVALYEKAGRAYFDLWDKYGATPIKAGQQPQCEKLEEIVYNAARAFQAGRLIAKAISARTVLIDPTYHMDQTELAKDAMYEIGGNWQAIAVYDKAAEFYERYQKAFPRRKNADKALSDALILRLGLGQEDLAIADAKAYAGGNYGNAQTASIQFAVGAHYADKEEWDQARKALQGSMGVIDKAAPDVQLQAHATLARALMKLKSDAQARSEYGKVRSIWGSTGAAVAQKINDAYPNETQDQKDRRLGKALDAVGEALFMAAEEEKARKVDVLKFPVYQGSGNKDDVLKHIATKVKDWYQKKGKAIEEVDKDYQKVTELQPIPPPRWVIAAASRAGLMWGNFVDEFRAAPIPKEWKNDPEIRGTYYQSLDEASQPIKDGKAKPALVACLNKSVKVQYFDEYSRDCEKWLAKNYKSEYHIVDELRGAPTLSNSGLEDRPPPLIVGGLLWHPPATGPADEKAGTAGAVKAPDQQDDSSTKPAAKPKRRR